jgi:putative transposase
VIVTDEALRQWGRPFGHASAPQRRHRRPQPGDQGPLDEGCLPLHAARHSLWRAVDQAGARLDILGQRRRHKAAAKQLFRTRLQGVRDVPRLIITDHLNRDGAATRELLPGVDHRQPRDLNHRAVNLHPPTRQRERRLPGFNSPGQAQRCLSADGPMAPHVRPRRHLRSAPELRHERRQRFQRWGEITGTVMAASRLRAVPCAHLSASSWHPRESVDNAISWSRAISWTFAMCFPGHSWPTGLMTRPGHLSRKTWRGVPVVAL